MSNQEDISRIMREQEYFDLLKAEAALLRAQIEQADTPTIEQFDDLDWYHEQLFDRDLATFDERSREDSEPSLS